VFFSWLRGSSSPIQERASGRGRGKKVTVGGEKAALIAHSLKTKKKSEEKEGELNLSS